MGATKKILLVAVMLALIGLAWVVRDHIRVEVLLEQFRALGAWGPLAFILLYAFGAVPAALAIGSGTYAALLGINVYGLLTCTGLFLLPVGMKTLMARYRQALSPVAEVR